MKILSLLSLVLLFSMPVMAEEKVAFNPDVTVQVDGMSCEPCVATLEKAFSKQESVEHISGDLATQKLLIDTKDGASLSEEKIAELVDWAGFDLIDIAYQNKE